MTLADDVIAAVQDTFDVDVFENSRAAAVAEPRQLAMYLLRDAGWTLKAIGDVFLRDHSTVTYAVQQVERRMSEPRYRLLVAELRNKAKFSDQKQAFMADFIEAQAILLDEQIKIVEAALERLRDLRASL